MKRRSREISVFSTSAIDLFASAMGAFIIIALVLIVNKSPEEPAPPAQQVPAEDIQQLRLALQDALQAKAAAEAAAAAAQAQVDGRPAAMLGIVTDAKSFVVLLDMSGSMQKYEKVARQTLNEILDSMGGGKSVQIIGFQEPDNAISLSAWQNPRQLAAMSPQNTAAAKAFVDAATVSFDGGTPTRSALLEALQYNAEAIVLCSDGAPTRGGEDDDTRDIVREVTARNGGRKKIYTVAVGDFVAQPGFTRFLSELAASNGGKFIGVFEPDVANP